EEKEILKKINKFRPKFKKLEKEKMAFLLRNAIQNGMGGQWGKWLIVNQNNEKIIEPLVKSLKGNEGWRPMWRSAYVLEKTFGENIDKFFSQLDSGLKENSQIQSVIHVLNTAGVKTYLEGIAKNKQDGRSSKAQAFLQEIQTFHKQIEKYANEQTIKRILVNVK
ncbi:MAG: hypothetical protein AABZ32_08420, partial [Bacteroidota bacterium]